MARRRRKRAGRWALGTALAAFVACAGGACVAAFGLFANPSAQAGGAYIPPSILTTPPRLARPATAACA